MEVAIDTALKSNGSPLLFQMHFPETHAFPTVSAGARGSFNPLRWSNFLPGSTYAPPYPVSRDRHVQQVSRRSNRGTRRFRQIRRVFFSTRQLSLPLKDSKSRFVAFAANPQSYNPTRNVRSFLLLKYL